ncbi:hypothetical protein ES702_00365 [subsurface metagenome]
MIWKIKCRSCTFSTNDIMEVYEHSKTLGHKDYAFLAGDTVEVDWMHLEMELKRGKPEK